MKKIKDTIDELKKIKNYELIMMENNRIEKDTIDLKNTLTNAKNELRNIVKKARNDEDETGIVFYIFCLDSSKRSRSFNKDGGNKSFNKTSPTNDSSMIANEEHSNLVKKFQLMIIHLQNELTKSVNKKKIFFIFLQTITIHQLSEENRFLRDNLNKVNQNK